MRERQAFTLIEMMAVLLIFGLMAVFVVPNLSLVSQRAVRHEAERLAASLELARQRAVVTSVPHRLYLDLEEGAYRIEWLGDGDDPAPDAGIPELSGNSLLSLEAPRGREREYRPMAGELGRLRRLDPDVLISGVETSAGWIERGEVYVSFERDGSASYTLILLTNDAGEALEIEVLPLAASARVRRAES